MQLSWHCFFFRGGLGEDQGICMALALAYGSFSISTVPERVFFGGVFFLKSGKKRGRVGRKKAKQNSDDIVTYQRSNL